MKPISRRLEKLEKIFAPLVERETGWGKMAEFRDQLLRIAEQRGTPVAQLKEELDAMGLWQEAVRRYLSDHGFAQDPSESLAETVCRALEISSEELRLRLQQGQLGLVERFRPAETPKTLAP